MKNDFNGVSFENSLLKREYMDTLHYERLTMGIVPELPLTQQEEILRNNYAEVITDVNGSVPLFELGILQETGIEELHISMHSVLLDKLK